MGRGRPATHRQAPDYGIPTVEQMPNVSVELLEVPSPVGPFEPGRGRAARGARPGGAHNAVHKPAAVRVTTLPISWSDLALTDPPVSPGRRATKRRPYGPLVQNPSGSSFRSWASSSWWEAAVSVTSGAICRSQPVLAWTSSTVQPGWTEASWASPPPSGKRRTAIVVTDRRRAAAQQPVALTPAGSAVTDGGRGTRLRDPLDKPPSLVAHQSVTQRRESTAMSAPPRSPGASFRGRRESPT